jgi:hypothetical protein
MVQWSLNLHINVDAEKADKQGADHAVDREPNIYCHDRNLDTDTQKERIGSQRADGDHQVGTEQYKANPQQRHGFRASLTEATKPRTSGDAAL